MKKLTRGQLREIGVYSAWDFAKAFWFLTYNAPGRQTMRPGWRLVYPTRPNPKPDAWAHTDYAVAGYGVNHRVHPDEMKVLPGVLDGLGIPCPSGWVKCLGAWMPEREYRERMDALCAIYKSRRQVTTQTPQVVVRATDKGLI